VTLGELLYRTLKRYDPKPATDALQALVDEARAIREMRAAEVKAWAAQRQKDGERGATRWPGV
jgi:hypothetical protein